MTEISLSLRLKDHRPEPVAGALPTVDGWLVSSALQKACRRNNVAEALRCVKVLVAADAPRLWRRVAVIAMEDIGNAGFDAIADAIFASRSKVWRDAHGGDLHVATYVVSGLCTAVKCRAADDLGLVAAFHSDFQESRAELACATDSTLCEVVADATQSLIRRSLAALFLSGTNAWSAPG